MPEICRFFGVVIYMYYFDHNPPHIHVKYGEYSAIIYLNNEKIEGKLPGKVKEMVKQWVRKNKNELLHNWELSSTGQLLKSIKPL